MGLVYRATAGTAAAAKERDDAEVLRKVLPDFDNNPQAEKKTVTVNDVQFPVYTARKGGQIVGYAVETLSTKGYGGDIILMVGFTPQGEIVGIEVLSQNETPGLGDRIENGKSNFSTQFIGKNPATFRLRIKREGGQVDAITASTISSRAYCQAVQRGYAAVMQQVRGQ